MRGLDLAVAAVALLLLYSSARIVATKRDVSLAARRLAKATLALFLAMALRVVQDYGLLAPGTDGVVLGLVVVAGIYFLGSVRARRSSPGRP